LSQALEHLVTYTEHPANPITVEQFYELGLTGGKDSTMLRDQISKMFHEYYLPGLVEIFLAQGKKVIAIPTENWRECEGVDDNVALAEAAQYLKQKINHAWMVEGVTIIDPESTYIGPDVTFGHDIIIHPNTYLYGKTVVEDGAEVLPGFYCEDTVIHKNEIAGPFRFQKG
jgi:N-acetylglucosamine-1-phosphate uridyltransferase (contains nucleotidyltransferase and I-patch acetyltransferase domains)